MVDGYQFMPAYKNKMWDGRLRLFNINTRMIYSGLYSHVIEFLNASGYDYVDETVIEKNDVSIEEIKTYITEIIRPHSNGKPIETRDYQIAAIHHAINEKKCLLVSPTSSGKSLILYSIIRYLLDNNLIKRALFIFPSISLVTQMRSDFADYSTASGWNIHKYCHSVYAGMDKDDYGKRIVFTTWQSIYKLKPPYYSGTMKEGNRIGGFDAIITDECHGIIGKSLTSIYENAHNIQYRMGATGTLQGAKAHKLVIEGLTGKEYNTTTTATLMKNNHVAQLKIKCLLLNYPAETRKLFIDIDYKSEMDFISINENRNKFIVKLSMQMKGNTLLLFTRIKHGDMIQKMLKEAGHKKVYFLHGKISADIREETRKLVENSDGAIIVASYGIFSTGVSIKKLNNLVLCSPYKSRIKVLQSLGRILRLAENKKGCIMFDIADDISHKSNQNHTLKHFQERINYYAEEKFDYKIIDVTIK